MVTGLSARRKALKSDSSVNPSHLIIIARAGTGKTTTLVEGLKVVRGIASSLTPSPQQAAIWEELSKSQDAKSVCFAAFNKSIQLELERRLPRDVESATIHRLGRLAVFNAFRLKKKDAIDGNKTQMILEDVMNKSWKDIDPLVLGAVNQLVGLCKANLLDPTEQNLDFLTGNYDVETNGKVDQIYDLTAAVLDIAKNKVNQYGIIDFNDMIWLPVIHDLPVRQYDLLLVDEAQDLNRCQQALVMKASKRLILCGDDKQAIYGFAGADSKSLSRMANTLEATDRGCQILPLTTTYRCGKTIVKEVQGFVPDFSAHESNPEGIVSVSRIVKGQIPKHLLEAKSGDMILCRTNAPLVSQCFKLLAMGKKAAIQGRKIGEDLISLINRLKAKNIEELSDKLQLWYNREVEKEEKKKFPSESRLINLSDRRDCLECFIQDCDKVSKVVKKISSIFTDDTSKGILLSSMHRSKGLEAKRVFLLLLKDCPVPHFMAKTASSREQEYNLLYVAKTRAIEHLTYVYDAS